MTQRPHTQIGSPPVTRHEIRDATGHLVAIHCRRDQAEGRKQLWWESADGSKGLGAVPLTDLPLYRIDRLDAGSVVVLCEGEKATDALWSHGIQAVGTVTGAASCPGPAALGELGGRHVVVWPDSDEPGRAHMARVAQRLRGIASRISQVNWAEAPEHGDAADFFADGKTADDARVLLDRAVLPDSLSPLAGDSAAERGDSAAVGRRPASQPSQLLALGNAAELFHTPDQEPYAAIAVDDHVRTVELRSREMKGWLRRRYFAAHGSAAGSRAVDEAIDELEAVALFEGPEVPVHLRVAEHDGRLFVDLGDRSGRAVEIGGGNWRLIDRPPVHFRRSASQFALPEPVRGGSIDDLRPFLNVADDAGFRMLVGYLLAAFRPIGPYPVLVIRAEQGAAKTAVARVLRGLIDPARSLEIAVPRDQEGLLVAARHHHVVSIDNVSSLPNWLSDDLARLATGTGVALRVKYTTLDELSLYICRPAILNGIEDFVVRADLADRSWIVELPALPDARKRDEEEFAAAYRAAAPRILGAVFDAAAAGQRGVEDVRMTPATRMVGAARFVIAAESALGWPPGAFQADLAAMRAGSRDSALEASPLTAPLLKLAREGSFSGTADELRGELERRVDERTATRRDWPMSARGLSGQLRRLVPDLRAAGIEVLFGLREPHTRRRLISLSEAAEDTVPIVPTDRVRLIDGDGAGPASKANVADKSPMVRGSRGLGDGEGSRGRSDLRTVPLESKLRSMSGDSGDGLPFLLDEQRGSGGVASEQIGLPDAIAWLRARLDAGALDGQGPIRLTAAETVTDVPGAARRRLLEAEGDDLVANAALGHLERLAEALRALDQGPQ